MRRAQAHRPRGSAPEERQDWTSPYYQMANRLAFLYFLRKRQRIPSRDRLIVGPKTADEWEPHISSAYDGLGLKRANPLSPFVLHTFLPVQPAS